MGDYPCTTQDKSPGVMAVCWGGHMPSYLQGLGQSYEIPLHLFTGLQLGLQP